jgi:glutathione S-transferase
MRRERWGACFEGDFILTTLQLHFAPDTCARVPLIALEEVGNPYTLEVVAFMKGQHLSPEYLALNPKGKVPTLVVDREPLTENVAILTWLADRFPDSNLLPRTDDSLSRARVVSDLAYCASGLHPIVTRLRIPQYFCDTPDGVTRVFEMAESAMRPNFALIEARLAQGRWWYGDRWSIVDAYINWVWFRVSGTAFKKEEFVNFARHDIDMKQRPAVARALAINAKVAERLASQGLAVKFSGPDAWTAPPKR